MIWLILLLIVLFIFIYLLLAPFYLEINSDEGWCRIRFHHLAIAGLHLSNDSLILDLKIMLWQKQIDLLTVHGQKKKPAQKKIKRQKKKAGLPFRKAWAVTKTFRANECDLSFDFGEMPVNGVLYPLFRWASLLTRKNIRINFWNENKIILELENNFARMIWAYIKS